MKRIIETLSCLLAVAALTVSCDKENIRQNHKVIYATGDQGKLVTLSYDNTKKFASNTANRSKIYDIEGLYVKLTLCDNGSFDSKSPLFDPEYDPENPVHLMSAACLNDTDVKDEQLLDAGIVRITEEGQTVEKLKDLEAAIANLLQEDRAEEGAGFSPIVELEAGAGYAVKAEVAEGDVRYFAFVAPIVEVTETPVEEVVDQTPFGEPVTVEVKYSTTAVTIIYNEFTPEGVWK